MPHWGFWEWLAYTGIWISAIILAADVGLKMSADLRNKFDHIITNPLWGFTPLILLTLSGAILFGRQLGFIGGMDNTASRLQDAIPQMQPTHDLSMSAINKKIISDQDKAKYAAILSKLRDKFPQRIIADITPDFLTDLYKDHMSTEGDRDIVPYVGKWLLLSGAIDDQWKSYKITVLFLRWEEVHSIVLSFDDIWSDHLSVLRRQQNILAFCQVQRANSRAAFFEHCELIDQDLGPEN